MIGQTISHYRILEKIGEGGMGVVYKAEDIKLHRPVAVKFLPLDKDATRDQTNRFIREAQAAASLSHPNIATVFELNEVEDPATHSTQAFIAMEYIEGSTLEQLIHRERFSFDTIRDIAMQIGHGLQSAHDRGIIHRDVKPSNIIINNEGVAKLLDFGLAKLVHDTTISQAETAAGSIAYMSPEQVRAEKLDVRTDIWSYGVVLFQMLSGRLPFRGDHAPAMMYSITNEPPTEIDELLSRIPEDLADLCRRCLEKEREKRPASMAEILQCLGTGEREVPRFWPHRARRMVRSNLTLTYALVLLFGIVGSIYLFTSAAAIDVSPSDYVLITRISNETGDSLFNSSLTEAIRVSLRQSRRFSVLPNDRVFPALQRMGLPENSLIDEQTGILLARREGIRVVLATSISRLGSKYVLSGRIIDGGTSEAVALVRQEVASLEDILEGVDRLSEDIRETLGESISEISRTTRPLEQVTTSSLEALELYSRGGYLERQGKYEEAAILKGRAVELDSLFTMAVSDLSYIHRKLGNDSLALMYHYRVLPLIDRVTEPERYQILSFYYGPSFELDFHQAYQSLQQLVVRYPNNAEGYVGLGHLAMFAGDFSQALEADAKYLSLDSVYQGTVYNNMGFAYSLAGEPQKALDCYRKSKSIRPTYYTIDAYIARAWWIAEDFDSVLAVLEQAIALADPRSKIQLYLQLASYYHFQGQLEAARQICLEGLSVSRTLKRIGDESWFLYLLGEIAYEYQKESEYLTRMRESLKFSQSPFLEYAFVGASLAQKGHTEKAQRVLHDLDRIKSSDPYFLKRVNDYRNYIRGEDLLARKFPSEALKKLRSVKKLHAGDPLYFLAQKGVAECLFALSDSSWIEVSQMILDHRGEVVTSVFISLRSNGFWVTDLWPDIQAEFGFRLAKAGRTKEGLAHINAALQIWKEADSGFRRVHGLRVMAKKLTGK